jgi:hypothetical protein
VLFVDGGARSIKSSSPVRLIIQHQHRRNSQVMSRAFPIHVHSAPPCSGPLAPKTDLPSCLSCRTPPSLQNPASPESQDGQGYKAPAACFVLLDTPKLALHWRLPHPPRPPLRNTARLPPSELQGTPSTRHRGGAVRCDAVQVPLALDACLARAIQH